MDYPVQGNFLFYPRKLFAYLSGILKLFSLRFSADSVDMTFERKPYCVFQRFVPKTKISKNLSFKIRRFR